MQRQSTCHFMLKKTLITSFYALKGAKYGPTKGTVTNAFCCMRSGVKNCDANGNAGPIPQQTKKLVVCSRISIYLCAFPFLIPG